MTDLINITVTLIRSFKFRTTALLGVVTMNQYGTVEELFDTIDKAIRDSQSIPPPFRMHKYDAFKIRHQAHHAKSGDLLIDMTGDPVKRSSQSLSAIGIVNETEVAFFNSTDYAAQASNPVFLW
ncbi:hypothetical protein D915_003175 [Fasciola hepatica]|uniref:Uncharacterized protein n=1 Tax=Fasciola hepatica TaxID=6192 RepID=A0A4E0RGE7_FASHE|nr:hypothetical protein D915_003175 [Fasciola hepatica]